MKQQLSDLYKQIKAGTISHEDAAEQFKILSAQRDDAVQAPAAQSVDTSDKFVEMAADYFRKLLSGGLKVPAHRIQVDTPMEEYGIDSVMVMQLTAELERVFGPLSKTLFFEYQTIQALADYFIESHREKLTGLLGMDKPLDEAIEQVAPALAPAVAHAPRRARFTASEARSPASAVTDTDNDVAIIGVSGRYPQAKNIQTFWENLRDGKDCVTEIPKERWDHSMYFDADKSKLDKAYTKWGGFIDGVDQFDPLFFNIAPRDAEIMDPQERLFLQCVYSAMEDGGYAKGTISQENNVGVYVGVMYEEYQLYGAQEQAHGRNVVLSGSSASIANRVSYFCNFHGPSMALDTMCSSSLTAIHLACQSLQKGSCELAIAGGVNVSIHPNKYLMLSQGKFASSTGQCESFGDGGDGYVPGEGVGAVLLKSKAKAIADGDHIYGIIKATAINHGGKTNGYTVPNPNAQGSVVQRAMKEAGIDPRTVSYIEAHGTGTSLGDPIEIAGLNKAFQQYTQDKQFCAIGSAKSNIGHCESAAGIAGVTKVLLQMKHRQLVPSLHSKVLNPLIDFANSPFVVQQELAEWKRPVVEIDGQMKEFPRIAGISSFGAGGSNAHVVIEEYIPQEQARVAVTQDKPALIVLSARNAERLRERARQLLDAISAQSLTDADLGDVAYTLQVGREAMDDRVAFLSISVAELRRKLEAFVNGQSDIDELFQGQAKRNKDALGIFAADEEMQETISKWLQRGKYSKLLDLWVKGMAFDWNKLYGNDKPRRISLPTYPFAQTRYWVPRMEQTSKSVAVAGSAQLHPLLHRNTSDLAGPRFSSTFNGEEFFLADHLVQGKRVLPGVAYLEMARAAVSQASGITEMLLKDIVWVRPVTVGTDAVDIHIGLHPEDNGDIGYEIYSVAHDGEAVVHSQGVAVLNATAIAAAPVDLSAMQAACGHGQLDATQCYDAFKQVGIVYGPAQQAIRELHIGNQQVLAKLRLPGELDATGPSYVLHPSIMDGALQASLGLAVGQGDSNGKPALPFALQELDIMHACTPTMWALVRYSAGCQPGDALQKLDIDLCDEQGTVCVRLQGFTSRVLEGMAEAPGFETAPAQDTGPVMLLPVWDCVPLAVAPQSVVQAERMTIIGGTQATQDALRKHYPFAQVLDLDAQSIDTIAAQFQSFGSIAHLVWIAPEDGLDTLTDDRVIAEQQQGVVLCFRIIKALLALDYGRQTLAWTVITSGAQAVNRNESINPTHASVHGLIGSMAKEYPQWNVRLVDMPGNDTWPVADLDRVPADPQGNAWVCRGQQWYRQRLLPSPLPAAQQTAYRQQGVYVVIGGAGGIGEAWSEYMIRSYGAQIIWIGRREKDAGIQAKLDRLAALGPAPRYIAADATDRQALQLAYTEITRHHPRIHGVVHAAIVLLDKSIANMDEERFQAALSAKIDTSVRMAQVFGQQTLDFVLFFSSMQSMTKAPGQSNYAAGCTFKDSFGHQLNQEWNCPVKIMNWGYWGSVGVVASEGYRERMAQLGLGSIEPEEGMRALETLLSGPMMQVGLLKISKPMINNASEPDEAVEVYAPSIPSTISDVQTQLVPAQQFVSGAAGQSSWAEIEAHMSKLLHGQLQSLDLFTSTPFTAREAGAKIGLPPSYDRWLEESLQVLARNDYVRHDGDTYFALVTNLTDMDAAWRDWDERKAAWLTNPDFKSQVVLVETTLRALPRILQGQLPATEVMFPNSSMHLVEGIYKQNRLADYFNGLLADTLVCFIQERIKYDPGARIRIIEIGAGTGGTSALLFARLKPYQAHIAEYCYTDLSKAFLLHAQKEYGPDNPYLTYRLLDVGQPVARQDIEAGGYDAVVATNVMHATKNIRQSLRNAKAVLRANGLILLNEISNSSLFTHLTFGLLDGWWLYDDPALRIPGSPALYPETWQSELEKEGFHSVFFPAQEARDLGQQIIVAESDGVVRQVRAPAAAAAPVPAQKAAVSQPARSMDRSPAGGQDLLREKSTVYFKKLVGDTLKIPVNQIDSSEPLEKYGIDSILIVSLTNALTEVFGTVSRTLFFEYQTIDALVDHFVATQEEALVRWTGFKNQAAEVVATVAAPAPVRMTAQFAGSKSRRFLPGVKAAVEAPQDVTIVRDVAIIGLSGRYANANHVDEFWRNLKDGLNCITEIGSERWDHSLFFDETKNKPGKTYSKWGGFIEGVDKFDPLFFNISPREAEIMDPQERLFLEEAHASIEDAGYSPAGLCASRKVGVFVGVMNSNYPSGTRYWSVANRISYLFNFQGPSMAIDTACSSSLSAIHLALESLRSGTSECVIAGGVNLIVDPAHYVGLSSVSMLSSGDQCRSFGDGADGFVDGEGVGAIVLKPLQKAIEDGDHVYGVIKGSMVNTAGKTNGYTVPSPNVQSQLIADAMQRANVHPRTVSYIEAHGTGTSLGDPIEIAGLNKAFSQHTQDKQFCAIGSAKSNIGHCESAAGIAAVTKVLMQMKHRQLVPSLHSRTLNPHIDFANSPFIVQQELAEWKRPMVEIGGTVKEFPRIAGISAFGAGGANAHVVIEEYIPQEYARIAVSQDKPALIVLSARTGERVREQARLLLNAIATQSLKDADLADMAYTLQVGREAMDERLAVVAGSIADLQGKLDAFVKGQDGIDELYQGQVKRNKDALGIFAADEELHEAIGKWVQRGKYSKLLDLWVKGLTFDWNKLYGEVKPHRLSLPTYPFAKERYWITPPAKAVAVIAKSGDIAVLHPLLQMNTSDLSEQRFSSTFTGEEVFLSDRLLSGKRVLPGVAYLEMARAAAVLASGAKLDSVGMRLQSIVWSRPLDVNADPVEVHIGLYPKDNGVIAYEIYSTAQDGDAVVHGQGIAVPNDPAQHGATVDIAALRAAWTPGHLDYPGISELFIGQHEVLAKLHMMAETGSQYVLHPRILDGAMQAARVLADGKPVQPSALRDVEIISGCKATMWALVRCSAADLLDIDLCDEHGTVCVRLKGLTTQKVAQDVAGTLLLRPDWQLETIASEAESPDYAQHLVLLCGIEGLTAQQVEGKLPAARCVQAVAPSGNPADGFRHYANRAFIEIQALLLAKPRAPVLFQIVVPVLGQQQVLAALSALLKTARLENPKLQGQLIAVEDIDADGLADVLRANGKRPQEQRVRYEDGNRLVAGWKEVVAAGAVRHPWKDHGIYLITGGAGGLGLLFAKEIATRVKAPTLILTGRSSLAPDKRPQLEELVALGARVEYQRVDVTQADQVKALMAGIRDECGQLNGILHSAGVTRDSFLIKKSAEDFNAVLAPKVDGLNHLDQASKDIPLDFLITFSSSAGALGNIGQADYATGNAFMDTYAVYRNSLVALELRHGKSLSVNWPLWKEGGMQVDAATEQRMALSTGMIAMRTDSGIAALYRALDADQDQVMVFEGDLPTMRNLLLTPMHDAAGDDAATDAPITQIDASHLKEKVLQQLKALFGGIIKLSAAKIDADEPLESYGIDSIVIAQINSALGDIFTDLSKTLFYEYQTLQALADHFIAERSPECMRWTGLAEQAVARPAAKPRLSLAQPSNAGFPLLASLRMQEKEKGRNTRFSSPVANQTREPMAIIGVAGRYAKSRNPDAYWENLAARKDCITEIPEDRWDYKLYFDEDKNKLGSTYSKWGGFIDGFADFDPLFFNISPRDAINIDPQERIFIENCWELFEDAGYTKKDLVEKFKSRIGVFAGITKTGFDLYGPDLQKQGEAVFPHTSFGSLANRVSYFLNLHGPSMPIDTMCSASLTAIHEACEHIYRGECDMAIAGGVNLYLHPSSYIGLSAQKMLSADGQCKSFGQGGNGFVPGEGVGTVLLKPLSKAIADQDHIYALVRGTSINHGGKTNGYMVPNPVSQGKLVREALDKAGIDARTVSYIEAHGTGTELGDPIEITGLTQAFRKDTQDKQFCAIGSAKSNIGHCESAAGIAGVTKVLLQMKHRKLVPSLHSGELNPNIDFANSPFVVQQELTEWKRPVVEVNGQMKEYPRIAGISSFGAGGSNAHVVIEEYIPQERAPIKVTTSNPALIVLSARHAEQLRDQARQLLNAIVHKPLTDADLADIAYTLQIGREAMDERMAVSASSMADLQAKLEAFVQGKADIDAVYQGQVKRNKEALSIFAADEELQEAIGKWVQRGKYAKLLELWVKGLAFDWTKLYGDTKPRRISLPTYPFAKEKYWLPALKAQERGAVGAGQLHPLLHRNTSNLDQQRFSSTFTGEEFFLADHLVQGKRVMPGVAYLEMARAAAVLASGSAQEQGAGMRLENIVWARPIVVDASPVEVHIGLYPDEHGAIAYEIYSGAQRAVHSQGLAVLGSSASVVAPIEIAAVQAQCTSHITTAQCYELFKQVGLAYGPGHQSITEVHIGHQQVLAKLRLPAAIAATGGHYVLHPSIMDGALQATLGLSVGEGPGKGKPALPFALQELEIIHACTSTMWALVRYSAGSQPGDALQKLDIDLCDEQGTVCVRLKGFTSRFLESEAVAPNATGTILLQPEWRQDDITQETVSSVNMEHVVLLCGLENLTPQQLEDELPAARCVRTVNPPGHLAEKFRHYAQSAFAEIQALLLTKPTAPVLFQVVVPVLGRQQVMAALSGLLKSARLENGKLLGQLIAVEDIDAASLADILRANGNHPHDQRVRYEDGNRWVAGWKESRLAADSVRHPWKDHGIYLITGGAGGLGLLFAKEIASRVKAPTLILTGRSKLAAAKRPQLEELVALGARVEYQQVDVSQADEIKALMAGIRNECGQLNGILHSAGITRDSFLIKKTVDDFDAVLAPKVDGLIHLDEASKDVALDFLIAFSSSAGALGNVGQGDYAAGNAFMDAYAAYRNSLVALEQRHGQSLSVNWPLWKEGGMQVDAGTEQMLARSTGMIPMHTESGIAALYRALAADQDQVMVAEGNLSMMRAMFSKGASPKPREKAAPKTGAGPHPIKPALIAIVSDLMKIKPAEIDGDEEWGTYGFDSITLTEFANAINQKYQLALTPTVFFECTTLNSFIQYLETEYQDLITAGAGGNDGGDHREHATRQARRSRFADTSERAAPDPAAGDIAVDDDAVLFMAKARDIEKKVESIGLERAKTTQPEMTETPTQAGMRMITVAGAKPIPVALYYPTRSVARARQIGAFSPLVALNGELPTKVKGLILISHGTGGNELGHCNLAQRLAEEGYLVAAVQHPGDNWHDQSLTVSPMYFAERPKPLSIVIDTLLADPDWQGKIPADKIGAIGHSAGGTSVIALLGGVVDPRLLVTHCETTTDDQLVCRLAKGFSASASAQSIHDAVSRVGPADFSVRDSRIRAAIVMAPMCVGFVSESLAGISTPLKIYIAENDLAFNGKYHGRWLHEQLPGAQFEEVKGAGHFSFMATPNRPIPSIVGDAAESPAGFDREAFHRALEHDVTRFFDQKLQ